MLIHSVTFQTLGHCIRPLSRAVLLYYFMFRDGIQIE